MKATNRYNCIHVILRVSIAVCHCTNLYGVQSIPATFLVDPDGKIIAMNLRGGQLHEKLNEVLK